MEIDAPLGYDDSWEHEYSSTPEPKAPAPARQILPYFTFADTEPNLEVSDFVEGLLVEGAMSVIYGESNAGKTFWVTDLALHIATGRPWCGREVKQGAVIYLALEGSHGIKNRVAAFKAHYNYDHQDIPFVVVPVGLNLLDPDADATAVVDTCRAVAERFSIPLALIVVDTLARAMAGGNENASEDMGALVTTGDMMRQATGAHLTYIHHSGKDTAKGARGHSSLRAATDTEIEITADGKARQAEVRKQRDLEGGEVWQFELEPIVLGTNARGKDVTSCVVRDTTNSEMSRPARSINSLKGHNRRAFQLLIELLAQTGQTGHAGTPDGTNSCPDKWWREQFYEKAMPSADQDTKKRTFRRAADFLVESHFVGMARERVWIVNKSYENGTNDG
ncbi:MAG TPA: helicase RepA family protein [Halothiobacillus sp.]|nr:helicase RepA family protein [Halothiobacillus sp.]